MVTIKNGLSWFRLEKIVVHVQLFKVYGSLLPVTQAFTLEINSLGSTQRKVSFIRDSVHLRFFLEGINEDL